MSLADLIDLPTCYDITAQVPIETWRYIFDIVDPQKKCLNVWLGLRTVSKSWAKAIVTFNEITLPRNCSQLVVSVLPNRNDRADYLFRSHLNRPDFPKVECVNYAAITKLFSNVKRIVLNDFGAFDDAAYARLEKITFTRHAIWKCYDTCPYDAAPKLTNLTALDINVNQTFDDDHLEYMTNLTELNMAGNKGIAGYTLHFLTKLVHIDISHTMIPDTVISKLTGLTSLVACSVFLRDDGIKHLRNLTQIVCNDIRLMGFSWPANEVKPKCIVTIYDRQDDAYEIPLYKGEMENGKLHGIGTLRTHSGSFHNGLHNGVTYDGQFVNNKFHGHGVLAHSNGTRYEAQFENGVICGNDSLPLVFAEILCYQ